METNQFSQLLMLLSVDPYLAPFAELREEIKGLPPRQRSELLMLCEEALNDQELRAAESSRLALIKVLVALLPESSERLIWWLGNQSLPHAFEVHFSLFCFLNEVEEASVGRQSSFTIPTLIEGYLMNVPTEDALAAWMAGDLLGDHWAIAQSMPILLGLSRRAKHPAGRKGAVHGLSRLLTRLDPASSDTHALTTLLSTIAHEDPDQGVRDYAAFCLKGASSSLSRS